MVSIPNIRVAKPKNIMPVSFFLLSLDAICRMIPIRAKIGVKEDGFRSLIKKLSPEIPPKLKIHAVTVVPTFAPMITLIACFKVMSPEFTKPTTMTVVAEELWITAVTATPVRIPATLPVVSFPKTSFKLFPARLSSACPIRFMPNKNRLNPPIIVSKSKKSICFIHPFFEIKKPYTGIPLYGSMILNKYQIKNQAFVKSM